MNTELFFLLAFGAWLFAVASVAAWVAIHRFLGDSSLRSRADVGTRSTFGGTPTVLLLRPCAGDEPRLFEALASSTHVDPGAAVRFLIAREDDGAAATARSVAAMLVARGRDVCVVVTGASAPNRKADQLARGIAGELTTADIVMVADSDVAISSESYAALLRPLTENSADACAAPPIEVAPHTLGDFVSAAVLDASLQAFGVLSVLDPRGMVGKMFAIRSSALVDIGGFEDLTSSLGEDMELARKLSANRKRVVPCVVAAHSLARGRSLRQVIQRYTRWLAVIRSQRPALLVSYPLLIASAPLQLAFALGAWIWFGATWPVLATLACRALAAWVAGNKSPRSALSRFGFAFFADAILLAAFARVLCSRNVTWRGVALQTQGRVLREGAS